MTYPDYSGGSHFYDNNFTLGAIDQTSWLDNPDVIPEDGLYVPDNTELSDFVNKSLSEAIIQSQVYKNVHNILSQDSKYGSQFLARLEAIPYSTRLTDQNFWDNVTDFFGGTSKFDEAFTDAYNQAMDEIRVVLSDYQAFINSLPETQIQQQKDAGYNAAITGQGVDSSSMDANPSAVLPNTSSSAYSNDQLSQGISSFVEFIGSVASLATGGVASHQLLGLLDIAEQEQYNKQEVHDLLLQQMGYKSSNPFMVASRDNLISREGSAKAKVATALAESDAGVLDKHMAVSVGNNPDEVQSYEIMTGLDVLSKVSEYRMLTQFSQSVIDNISSQNNQLFVDLVSSLDNQARVAESGYTADYFSARDGLTEGRSATSVSQSLATIRDNEARISEFNKWIHDYKYNTLYNWGEQVAKKPYLAPFLYKALFDFGMDETFYNLTPGRQWTHYGLDIGKDVADVAGAFISGFTKARKPVPKVSTTRSGSEIITD